MSFSLMSKKLGNLLSQQMSRPTNAVVGTRALVATTGNKNTLNRRDLAAAVAEEHELSLAQSERIVKSVFDTIVDKVAEKGTVRIADFGTFDSMLTKARTYRVPNSTATVDKPATQRPRFKAYDSFKKAVISK